MGPDGRTVFVAAYGGNGVTRIDVATGTATTLDLGEHTSLHGIAVSGTGDRVWVTAEESAAVLELDTRTGRIVKEWPTRGDQSHMVTATPDGGKLYVANIRSGGVTPDGSEVWVSNRSGNVAVFDRARRELVGSVAVGSCPLGIGFSSGGSRAYVTRPGADQVVEIDADTLEILRRILTGDSPDGVVWVPEE